MTIKSLFLALLIAALGGSLCAQTPNGGYSSPAAGNSSTSGATSAGPVMGFYLGGPNSCSPSNIGFCFNTFADTQIFADCGWTAATPSTVTCAGSHFTAADVGKQVAGWNNCQAFATNGGAIPMGSNAISVSGAPLITSFISGTQVQITTAANAQTGTASCFIYGHPDDANVAILEAAYGAVSAYCPKVFLAAANYMFTQPHFSTTPPGCAVQPMSQGQVNPGFGNVYYSGGFDIEGRGVGATSVYLMPNFPNGVSCNKGPSANACFQIPTMGRWNDWSMSGGSNALGMNAANWALIYANVATLENFTCTNFGGYEAVGTGTGIGTLLDWQVQLVQYNNSGCGNVGLSTVATHGVITGMRVAVENSLITNLQVNGTTAGNVPTVTLYDSTLINSEAGTAGQTATLYNRGGYVILYRSRITGGGNAPAGSALRGYYSDVSGSILDAHDSIIDVSSGNTGNTAMQCFSSTCTTVLQNTKVLGGSAGLSYFDTAGSTFNDLGGNSFTPAIAPVGNVIADGHSLTGICTGVGTAASTLALRISGTSTTGTGIPTTCTSTTLDAGVPMTQARTVSTMLVTATAAGTNASSGVVTVLKNGVATTITCTIGTGTSCNDFTHTVAFVKGDLLSMQFTTQAADTLAGVKAQVMWQ